MGRDDHNKSSGGQKFLQQTPKQQKNTRHSTEFAQEFLDGNESVMEERKRAMVDRINRH